MVQDCTTKCLCCSAGLRLQSPDFMSVGWCHSYRILHAFSTRLSLSDRAKPGKGAIDENDPALEAYTPQQEEQLREL